MSVAGGFVGGAVEWFATNLLAQPLTRFLSLRAEVAAALSMHRNIGPQSARQLKASDEQEKALHEQSTRDAYRELRSLAARLLAFYQTEFVAGHIVMLFGIDPRAAAHALFRVANTVGVYGQERHDSRKETDKVLRLRSPEVS